jgi:hypothetical protein
MDLTNYYTKLSDTKSDLAIFIENGSFSYGSTATENQRPQTHDEDGASQDVQTATQFVLTDINITVTKVRMFEV